jgi:hypothetical protein
MKKGTRLCGGAGRRRADGTALTSIEGRDGGIALRAPSTGDRCTLRVMAKGDILKGSVLWCKAMLKKPKGATQAVAVDVALQEALNLIRKGKLDGDRSKADKKAEALIDSISDELAEIERKAREVEKKKANKK